METNLQTLDQQLRMAKYILELMRYYPAIVMSWGIDNKSYRIAEDTEGRCGLEFSVRGFKHKGKVQILYDSGSDTFLYHLVSESGETTKTKEDVFLDELIPSIDSDVELVDFYEERIRQAYCHV
ncbi:MAG: hypothetical protein IJL91_12160 [Bacteroidales bacterium]|nr:hypothetical protein [Bacteroidales bacterium]